MIQDVRAATKGPTQPTLCCCLEFFRPIIVNEVLRVIKRSPQYYLDENSLLPSIQSAYQLYNSTKKLVYFMFRLTY